MRLGLRTKLTMIMTGLVLLSTAVLSLVFSELLLQQVLHDTDKRATELARRSLRPAPRFGRRRQSPGLRLELRGSQEIHDYVAHAFEISDGPDREAAIGHQIRLIYEVTIVDQEDIVLVSSDRVAAGKIPRCASPPFAQLVQSSFVRQVPVLAGSRGDLRSGLPVQAARKSALAKCVSRFPRLLLNDDFPACSAGAQLPCWRWCFPRFWPRSSAAQRWHRFATSWLNWSEFPSGFTTLPPSPKEPGREHRRTRPGAPENSAGRAATARRSRNLQFPARKHEFRDGRPGRRLAALHEGCARGDGQPGGRKIPGCAGRRFSGPAGDGYFSAGASAVRSAAPRWRRADRSRCRKPKWTRPRAAGAWA